MNLYIQLKDGLPINHPIQETNLLMIYPGLNTDNLPSDFCKFVRVEKPFPKLYQVFDPEEPTYEVIDGVCYDVWHIRDMTEEEKQNKINELIARKPYPSWGVDVEKYDFVPPTPYPSEGAWQWNEETLSWVEYVEPTEPEA